MPHILAISVGPVQDFIAAARKTRDLWAGSEMLSEISREVANAVENEAGVDSLVFPPDRTVKQVANKIVAVVPDDKDPAAIATAARERAEELLANWLNDQDGAKKTAVKANVKTGINWAAAEAQLPGFLEFYAAWWPYSGEEEYARAREMADRLLAGRKALRDFQQAVSDPGVPKSSLDGGRDAVVNGKELTPDNRLALGIREGELLDGISLMKRLYEKDSLRFVSVSRVAADPFIRALPDCLVQEMSKSLEQLAATPFVQKLGNAPKHYERCPYDTQLFYGPPSDAEMNKEGLDSSGQDAVKGFCDRLFEQTKLRPCPHVAVLHADGDFMGALISSLKSKDAHRKLSEALALFARKAGQIVEKNCGSLVYSGGDDVLAFLPLDTALKCAADLHEAFKTELDRKPSLSVGVAVGHYSAPLQKLIEWSREAEHAAKGRKDANGKIVKNALAVHLHTHSAGDDFVASVRGWDENPVQEYWEKWSGLLRDEKLSNQAAYHLRALAREFRDAGLGGSPLLEKEARRIIARKREGRGGSAVTQEVQDALIGDPEHFSLEKLQRTVSELIISRRLVEADMGTGATGGPNP